MWHSAVTLAVLVVFHLVLLGRGSEGQPIVHSTSEEVPGKHAWVNAGEHARKLNNLVAELLNVEFPQKEAAGTFAFTNPRDGWVFISVTAPVEDLDRVILTIDPDPESEEGLLHGLNNGGAVEFMRQLPAGTYQLNVRCEGSARPSNVIVRTICELIYTGLGYDCPTRGDQSSPWLASYGPYDWKFLENENLIENINVILERGETRPENVDPLEKWRKQGKKVLTASFVDWLAQRQGPITSSSVFAEWSKYGFSDDAYYGTLMSEFSESSRHTENYPAYIEAVKRLSEEPRFQEQVFYPFTYGSMVRSELSTAFLKAVLDAGYRWAEERYLEEQPNEQAAAAYIDAALRQHLLSYHRIFPRCNRQLILNLGNFSVPHLSLDINPAVDFKVFLDMQMNHIANDPAFFDIYGMSWYHSAYADEEFMRWSAKLTRHYCIEGKKEHLTTDPYLLPHIENPDFDDGLASWELEPAETGTIAAGEADQYGSLQGRYKSKGKGNHFLIARRSAKAPNRFSQQIRALTPGRLYSLKMMISDYGDLLQKTSAEKSHDVSVVIDGAELSADKSFCEVFATPDSYGGFTAESPLYMTYRRIVFRAKGEAAKLVVSDWNTRPAGPIGQELAINYIQIEPFLE